MSANILMPDLGPGTETGKLARWVKKEGDPIKSGDVLAEVETDKATMEIEAVDDGTLAVILVEEGTADVPTASVIGLIAADDDYLAVGSREEGQSVKQGWSMVNASQANTGLGNSTSIIQRYIESIRNFGGLSSADVANITDASRATVSLWEVGAVRPQPNTQLVLSDLHYVVGRLSDYYEPHEIRVWLYAPHPQLDGKRAIDFINENRSADVLKILDRLDSEVYL